MKNTKRKVSLKFMDCSVSIEGHRQVEAKALGLLASLIQDRLKVLEYINEHDHADEDSELKTKTKKVSPDIMFV